MNPILTTKIFRPIVLIFALCILQSMAVGQTSKITFNQYSVIDLHCHPSMKMNEHNHLWNKHNPKKGVNRAFQKTQIDNNELRKGNVRGMLASHYLLENDIKNQSKILKIIPDFIAKIVSPNYFEKFEHENATNFNQIWSMINTFEKEVVNSNKIDRSIQYEIAHNYCEFIEKMKMGKIVFAHAIEGGHGLGRNFPVTDDIDKKMAVREKGLMENVVNGENKFVENLKKLYYKGVCLITIAHLFKNDLAFNVEGMSPPAKRESGNIWTYWHEKDNYQLTRNGELVVEAMLDLGVIVDLAHCTPMIRDQVIAMNRARVVPRPLTFSHVGSQELFDIYDKRLNDGKYKDFKYYNVTEDEVLDIEECGGVIGIIPENFWLVAYDPETCTDDKQKYKDGIKYIIETIQFINNQTVKKDYSTIAIGTDFDGLADAPGDLYKPSQLTDLIEAIRKIPNISDKQVRDITHNNALRLLKNGWGPLGGECN